MGKRRKAREAAIQYHFWRDLQHGQGPERIDDFWEFCPGTPRVRDFAQPLIEGMVAHPPVVSINEAIELAKTFGGAESGRFVNGILDRVKNDLTRPLREAIPKQNSDATK